ncbi:MAG: hypothetical protein ABIQ73_28645 [Acidimicrobiales bacterium]
MVVAVGCGGGGSSGDAAGSRKLSSAESEYAAEIAAANEDLGSVAEARCVGEGVVRAFGLARAKELKLESKDTPVLSRSDAEKAVGVLDGCTNLAELLLREGKDSLGLSEAEVIRCAKLLDRAKIRELFVKTQLEDTVDAAESQDLQDDLIAALPRCKG